MHTLLLLLSSSPPRMRRPRHSQLSRAAIAALCPHPTPPGRFPHPSTSSPPARTPTQPCWPRAPLLAASRGSRQPAGLGRARTSSRKRRPGAQS
eukprot:1994727-Rhodomonas_salina.2